MTNTEAAMIILDAAANAKAELWGKTFVSAEEAEALERKCEAFYKASGLLLLTEERELHRDISQIEEITLDGLLEEPALRKCALDGAQSSRIYGFHGFYPGISGGTAAVLEDDQGRVSFADARSIRFIKEGEQTGDEAAAQAGYADDEPTEQEQEALNTICDTCDNDGCIYEEARCQNCMKRVNGAWELTGHQDYQGEKP